MRVDQISLLAAFGAVAGPAFFVGGFRDLRLKRLIQNTPTSRIRSAAMGLVEVNGVVECRSTVAAPFSGRPCACWNVDISVQGKGKNSWSVVHRATSGHPFFLRDETGVALVYPYGADCRVHFGVEEVCSGIALPECYASYMSGLGAQRYLWRLRAHGEIEPVEFQGKQQPANLDWLDRAFTLGYWSEQGHEKEALLAGVMEFLIPRKYLIAVDPGWNRWDLEIYRGIWAKARITVAAENHGGSKRLLNVRCAVRLTRVSQLALLGFGLALACGLLFRVPEVAGVGAALGLVTLAVIVAENFRLGRILNDTLDIVAGRIALRPLGIDTDSPRAKAA